MILRGFSVVLNSAKCDNANGFFKVLLLSLHLLISQLPVQNSKFGACSVTGYCSFKTSCDFVQSVKTVNLSLMNQKLKSVITQTLPISRAIKNKYYNAALCAFNRRVHDLPRSSVKKKHFIRVSMYLARKCQLGTLY